MKKKNKWSTFILLLIFFIGLSVLLYPSIANYWNTFTQSEAITDYEASLKNMSKEDYEEMFESAANYNKELSELSMPLTDYSELSGYSELFNLSGTGMMGYIKIQKIGVELPLYHGTGDSVLAVACGHLEGTSIPVGGSSTHSVISAHRGLPNARLFTDLDKLEIGDIFEITILDRVFTYEVDRIRIVPPSDISLLTIEEGKDMCTLLTCTPYGINTDRLLVRGHRIETTNRKPIYIQSEAMQIDTLIVTPIVALPMLLVLMLIIAFKPVKKESEGDDI